MVPLNHSNVCYVAVFAFPAFCCERFPFPPSSVLTPVNMTLSHGGHSANWVGFRENCDLAILFRMHSIGQVEGCCENFLGHLDKRTAKNCLDEAVWKDEQTGQRQFLAVDMSGNSPLDHMLYAGQAKDPGPFRFGCDEWWANVNKGKK